MTNYLNLPVGNQAPPIVLELVHHEAQRAASGLPVSMPALESIVQSSAGISGSVPHMVKMAHKPQYWRGHQLKFYVLYPDCRMGRR